MSPALVSRRYHGESVGEGGPDDDMSLLASTQPEDIIDTVSSIIPVFGERLGKSAPSLIFDLAQKTKNNKGYYTLLQRKLGLRIN
jgi:hypothetical protein